MGMTVVLLHNGWGVPVPNGYTVERVVEILRKEGHDPVSVKEADGTIRNLKEKAA